MKHLIFFNLITSLFIFLFSCNSNDTKQLNDKVVKEQLVEVKNGKYTEWYPGKKQIKFEGMVDKKGKREGKWSYYSEKGTELSFTIYEHGVKQGHTVVKYPNGIIHYRGEYLNDNIVGVWTTYDRKGKVVSEKDYGYPGE
jgi:antitoxin component YwqK of YwqJK toxin-antitoxin module